MFSVVALFYLLIQLVWAVLLTAPDRNAPGDTRPHQAHTGPEQKWLIISLRWRIERRKTS